MHYNVVKDLLSSASAPLLRDFDEIKSIVIGSGDNFSYKFALMSYKKVIFDFFNHLASLNFLGYVLINDFHILEQNNIIILDQLIKKFNITHQDNKFIFGKDLDCIIFNPIDGFDYFSKGLQMFSTALCYQKFHSDLNQYKTICSGVYDILSRDLYYGDEEHGSLFNKIKIKKQNIEVTKSKINCVVNYFSQEVQDLQYDITTSKNINLSVAHLISNKYHACRLKFPNIMNVISSVYLLQKSNIKYNIVDSTIIV